MDMSDIPSDLMTASEARHLLGVSKPTLARLIREGALPAIASPLDKRVKLVRAKDVIALLRFRRGSAPEPEKREMTTRDMI